MNHTKGTIFSETLCNSSEDAILSAMENRGVVKVEQMKKRIDGELKGIPRFIFTFRRTELPPLLKITDWHHEIVDQFIPNPLRCINCQKFGHTKK